MSQIKGELIMATVAEDASGIHLRVATNDEKPKIEIAFLPVNEQIGDLNLKLKEGMDAQVELQKVCNLLNGYTENKDGSLNLIENFQRKQITIISGE